MTDYDILLARDALAVAVILIKNSLPQYAAELAEIRAVLLTLDTELGAFGPRDRTALVVPVDLLRRLALLDDRGEVAALLRQV